MYEVKCPEIYKADDRPSIFLAGGISNCSDWQDYAVQRLSNLDIQLINPRRSDFDITDINMTVNQITWEYNHLIEANAILFYFTEETVCPITLYELGVHAKPTYKKIFVACHPNYVRKIDVITQLGLINPSVLVYNSLDDMLDNINRFYNE